MKSLRVNATMRACDPSRCKPTLTTCCGRRGAAARMEATSNSNFAPGVCGEFCAKSAVEASAMTKYSFMIGVYANRRSEVPPAKLRGTGLRRSEEHTSELQSLRHLVCRL